MFFSGLRKSKPFQENSAQPASLYGSQHATQKGSEWRSLISVRALSVGSLGWNGIDKLDRFWLVGAPSCCQNDLWGIRFELHGWRGRSRIGFITDNEQLWKCKNLCYIFSINFVCVFYTCVKLVFLWYPSLMH